MTFDHLAVEDALLLPFEKQVKYLAWLYNYLSVAIQHAGPNAIELVLGGYLNQRLSILFVFQPMDTMQSGQQ
jgi:hypothetical protein